MKQSGSGPIWENLGRSGPIWAHLGQSGLICVHLDQSGPIQTQNLGKSGPIWTKLGQSVPIWAGPRRPKVLDPYKCNHFSAPGRGGGIFSGGSGRIRGDPPRWAKTTLRANMLCFTMVFAKVRRRAPGKGGRGEGKPSKVLLHSTKGRRIQHRAFCFDPP